MCKQNEIKTIISICAKLKDQLSFKLMYPKWANTQKQVVNPRYQPPTGQPFAKPETHEEYPS